MFEVVVTSFVSYDILLSGPQLKESVASEPDNFETCKFILPYVVWFDVV